MPRVMLAWLLLSIAGGAIAADASDAASGTFKSQAITMEVKSALAYRGHAFFEKSDEAIIVVVTNARVRADAIAEYYDRQRVVDKRIKDDETGVVYFEFRPDGKYHGLSYYFAPGNGCGFCSGDVTSTVKLANGRLTGSLTSGAKERSFNIALDVPVMTNEHGTALPADGGAPGKVYLAYHAALVKHDRATLKPLLSEEMQKTWAGAEKKGKIDGYVTFLASEHPDQSIRITKGFATGDTAILLVEGNSQLGKWSGEAMLRKQKDGWRVDDELMSLSLQ